MNPMFYFLLALTTVLAATANAGGPVLDTDGDIIFGGSYYVLPHFFGGGLTLVGNGAKPCPLYIGQEHSEVNRGTPVKFSNWRSRVGFVPESENLNINMDVKTICYHSTYWWLDDFDMESHEWFVKAGPKPEGFGEDSSKSFFQIKKYGDRVYSFAFCNHCAGSKKMCSPKCTHVGIFMDEYGVRRLALSATPFPVVFMKAIKTETSSKTMSINYLREI